MLSSSPRAPDPEEDPAEEGVALPLSHQMRAVLDTAERMRNGLLLYPAIWFILMLMDGYVGRHLTFVILHGSILMLASAGRALYHQRLPSFAQSELSRTRMTVRALSLAYNLYWGVLCALIMSAPDAPNLRWMMLVSTVGITAGGTVIVAIDAVLPLVYPLCTLAPTVVALLPRGGEVNIAIAALTAVFFAYSMGISRLVGRDYWARQRSQALLEQRAVELEALSRTDALTQVPNRLRFQEWLNQAWRDARRRNEPLAIAMVDLDHFKQINDSHGHPFGDLCLQAAAQALALTVHRPGDLVARFGGEEFVVLMPNTNMEGACAVAQRLLDQICATRVQKGEASATLSCSIGVAVKMPAQADRPEHLVQEADQALYRAKQTGRARVCRHDPDDQASGSVSDGESTGARSASTV
jgi:diguanylate cyclase (GGDEF)-like protein